MVSAVMTHLVGAGGIGPFADVVRRGRDLRPRPLGEDGEEAGDVLDNLPGVLAAEIAIKTRLPRLDGTEDTEGPFVACARAGLWLWRIHFGTISGLLGTKRPECSRKGPSSSLARHPETPYFPRVWAHLSLVDRLPAGQTAEGHAAAAAEALESRIRELGPEKVLAFVIEPVGGLATGCVVPPASYVRRVREICHRHGVYLIFDEILCGTGRTGKFLAAHHWPDALPDIVVMAKGLGSGYAPLGAVLIPAEMVDRLAELTGFNFSHTYNANPITCATGLAVLDVYARLDLVARAAERGGYLRERLLTLQARCPIFGDLRGLGLLMAVEMVSDKATKRKLPSQSLPTEGVRIHGLRNGLIIYSRRTAGGKYGDWFMIAPPLTITEAECDELVRRLDATLAAYVAELRASGLGL